MSTVTPLTSPHAAGSTHTPTLVLDAVRVGYVEAGGAPRVLVDHLDLSVQPGQIVGLWGRSGTGKTSLIRHLAGQSRPLAGTISYRSPEAGMDGPISEFSPATLARYRRVHLGYVDQDSALVPELSALDNATVWFHGGTGGTRRREAEDAARSLLERLGLGHRLGAPAARLSGGEAQRVALVRALAKRPRLIVADEPTGHLDGAMAREVIAVLREHARQGAAILVASHDPLVHAAVDHAVRLGED